MKHTGSEQIIPRAMEAPQTTGQQLVYENDKKDECQEVGGESSSSEQKTPQPQEQVYKNLVRDYKHFQYLKAHGDQGMNVDAGKLEECPRSPVEIVKYVARMVAAIKDTSDVIDNPMSNGKPAQAVQKFQEGHYPDMAIEMVAWELVDKMNLRHVGINLIDQHNASKSKRREDYESYDERFESILTTIRTSKAECKNLLDSHHIDRLVEFPRAELAASSLEFLQSCSIL
ncbi:hypothetical protein PVAG01_10760 [Phlyctema vagabunda]|uniref:Uncharacterized protein n=1 Tax=Phlyctema vagabunda TaxID=108571 RepID=A0ABR4P372_9HELO